MKNIDDLFVEDDDSVLVVPEFDADAVNTIDEYETDQAAIASEAASEPQTGTPGSLAECVICGKSIRVRKDGNLSAHKCEPKPQRGNRLEKLPDRRSPVKGKTREFCVSILAWCVEEASAQTLARPFGVDAEDVPTELPDAEMMVGVPLDILWPEIPDGARKFIDKLAENSDVIECGVAWFEWMRTVGKWTREQRAINVQRERMNNGTAESTGTFGSGSILPFTAPQG